MSDEFDFLLGMLIKFGKNITFIILKKKTTLKKGLRVYIYLFF